MKKQPLVVVALAALLSVGMYAVAAPAPAAHAAPTASHATVMRTFGPSALSEFIGEYTTASGQVIQVIVGITIGQSIQQPPGKPTGPMVGVSIIEFNTVTGDQLNGAGQAPLPPGTTIDGTNLTSAFLPVTEVEIGPTGDNPDAFPPYTAQVGPVSWTGEGAISSTSQTFHFKIPHVLNGTVHMSGQSRMATAVLTSVSYPSPLTGTAVTLTNLTSNPEPFGFPTELDNGRTTTTLVLHAPVPF